LLNSGRAVETLTARIVRQLKAKLEREVSDAERQLVLKEQAESFGLTPQDVDAAIREWGRKAEDPYQQGLAALYERNFKDAEAAVKEALEINEQELGPQDASVEQCLRALAEVYRATDRYDEAGKVESRANDINNKLTRDEQERDLAEAKSELADKEKEFDPEN